MNRLFSVLVSFYTLAGGVITLYSVMFAIGWLIVSSENSGPHAAIPIPFVALPVCAAFGVAAFLGGYWLSFRRFRSRLPLTITGLALIAAAVYLGTVHWALGLPCGLFACLTLFAVHHPAALRHLKP